MKQFPRRYYQNLRQLGGDLLWPLRNRASLRAAMGGDLVSFPFRERLMLTVTAVNDCRYCAYFHAKEGLRANLREGEIRQMLEGELGGNNVDYLLYRLSFGRVGKSEREKVSA
jgi:AhpD family alkylhydroperoxidase